MKGNVFFIVLTLVLLPCLFSSCQTLNQDRLVSTVLQEQIEEIRIVEMKVARIEAEDALSPLGLEEAVRRSTAISREIDVLLREEGLESGARAKLFALKGRCALLSDRKAEARQNYERAALSYRGEVHTVVLGSRLSVLQGDVEELRISGNEKGILVIEKAMVLYRGGSYRASAAKFDEAFLMLDGSYRLAYEKVRDAAWSMRDFSGRPEKNTSMRNVITVGQMLVIARDETSFLDGYSAYRKLSEAELYGRVSRAGLVSAGDGGSAPLSKDEAATRRASARFLWNLYTAGRKDLKFAYSNMFGGMESSPVADVPVDDADFDAVLGCIENEFMDLTDGENFEPERKMSGIEFSTAVKKLR